jgi:drug/metabolite transporter (DMT)-like permease
VTVVNVKRTDAEKAIWAVSLAVFTWGFGPLFVRGIHASAGAIVFWRFLFAQPVMIGFAYLNGGRLSFALLKRAAMPGMLFAGSMAASFLSYQKTSIVNASLIQALQPALLLVAAPYIFGTHSTRRQIFLAGVALTGMVAVVLGAGATSGASFGGDMWAVVNLTLWTVYFVWVKRLRDEGVESASLVAAVFLMAGVFATPVCLLTSHDVGSLGAKGFLFITLMAFGPGLIGHGLMTWSQQHLDIRICSLMGLLNPVVSTIGAWLIYSQDLRLVQVLGGALVLAGLAGIVWDHRTSARLVELELEPA